MLPTAAAIALGAYVATRQAAAQPQGPGRLPNAVVPLAAGTPAQYDANQGAAKRGANAATMGLLDFQLVSGANPWYANNRPIYPVAKPRVVPLQYPQSVNFAVDPGKWIPNYYQRLENFKRDTQAQSQNWQITEGQYRLEPSGIRPYKPMIFVSSN